MRNKSYAINEAREEAPFGAENLLLEIKPLIEDYFLGEFEMKGDKIVCKFLNGQTFNLTAEEVKENKTEDNK